MLSKVLIFFALLVLSLKEVISASTRSKDTSEGDLSLSRNRQNRKEQIHNLISKIIEEPPEVSINLKNDDERERIIVTPSLLHEIEQNSSYHLYRTTEIFPESTTHPILQVQGKKYLVIQTPESDTAYVLTLAQVPAQVIGGESKPNENYVDFYQPGTIYLQPPPAPSSKTVFTFPTINLQNMKQQYSTLPKLQAHFTFSPTEQVQSFLQLQNPPPPPQILITQTQQVQIPRPIQFLQLQNSEVVNPMIQQSLPQQSQLYVPQTQNYYQPSSFQQFLPQLPQFFPKGNYAAVSNQFPYVIPFGTQSTSQSQQPPQWAPFSFHTTPSFDISQSNQGSSWPFVANGPPPFLPMGNPYTVEVLNYEAPSYSMDQYNFKVSINTDANAQNSKDVSTHSENVDTQTTSSALPSKIETVDVGESSKLQPSQFHQDSSSEVTQPVLTNVTVEDEISTNVSSSSSNNKIQSQLSTISSSTTNTNSDHNLDQLEGSDNDTSQLNKNSTNNESSFQELSSEFSPASANDNESSNLKLINEEVSSTGEAANENSAQFSTISENNAFQSNDSKDSTLSASDSQSSLSSTPLHKTLGSMTSSGSSTMGLALSLFDSSNNSSKNSADDFSTLGSSSTFNSSSKKKNASKISSSSFSSLFSSSSSSKGVSVAHSSEASVGVTA